MVKTALFFLLFLTQEVGWLFLIVGGAAVAHWLRSTSMCTFDWLIWMANKGNEGKEKADSCGPSSSRNAARPWHKPKFHQVEEMCGFLVLDGLTTFDGEENVFFTIPSLCYIFFCIFRSNSASVCFLKVLATALSGDCLQRISTSLCEPLDKAANTGN